MSLNMVEKKTPKPDPESVVMKSIFMFLMAVGVTVIGVTVGYMLGVWAVVTLMTGDMVTAARLAMYSVAAVGIGSLVLLAWLKLSPHVIDTAGAKKDLAAAGDARWQEKTPAARKAALLRDHPHYAKLEGIPYPSESQERDVMYLYRYTLALVPVLFIIAGLSLAAVGLLLTAAVLLFHGEFAQSLIVVGFALLAVGLTVGCVKMVAKYGKRIGWITDKMTMHEIAVDELLKSVREAKQK